jgi:predicted ribosomally synthesized peptide with nif11-like leader
MSKQEVIKFFQAASKDQVIAEKLKAAINVSSLLEIASENGYEFTEQDLHDFKLEQAHFSLSDLDVLEELSDEQLLSVAGGQAVNNSGGKKCTSNGYPLTCVVIEFPKTFAGSTCSVCTLTIVK